MRRRTRTRRRVLRLRRLPPPRVAGVAREPSAGAVDGACTRRRLTRAVLPALVGGAPVGAAVRRSDFVHACGAFARDTLRSIRHRRGWPRLAPVKHYY